MSNGRQWSNNQPPRGSNPSQKYAPKPPGVYKHASDSEDDPINRDNYTREPRNIERPRDIPERRDTNRTSTNLRYPTAPYGSSYSSSQQPTALLEDRIGIPHDPLRGLDDLGRQFLKYSTEDPSSITLCAKFIERNNDLLDESVSEWRQRARNAVRGADPDLARKLLHQAELIKLYKEPDPKWIEALLALDPSCYRWFITQIWSRYNKYFNEAIYDGHFKTKEAYMLKPWARCVKEGLNEDIIPTSSTSQSSGPKSQSQRQERDSTRSRYDDNPRRPSTKNPRPDIQDSDTDDRETVPANPRESGHVTRTSSIPIRSRSDLPNVIELEDSSRDANYTRKEDSGYRRERDLDVYDKPDRNTLPTSSRPPRTYERQEKVTIPPPTRTIVYSKVERDSRPMPTSKYVDEKQPRYSSTNQRQATTDPSRKLRPSSKIDVTEDEDEDDDDRRRRRRPEDRNIPEDKDDDDDEEGQDYDDDEEPEVDDKRKTLKQVSSSTRYEYKKGQVDPGAEPRTTRDVPMNAIMRLSGLMREFVAIDERDFKACRDFTWSASNADIWREEEKSLLAAAEECLRQGREDYARRMIERYMMLKSAHDTGHALKHKVNEMQRLYKSAGAQSDLKTNCAKILSNMQARSASTTSSSTKSQPTSGPSSNNRTGPTGGSSNDKLPPSGGRGSDNVAIPSGRKDPRRG